HSKPDAPLPAYATPLSIADPDGEQLAALILAADVAHDSGLWVLHLHGNADSAFSAGQLRHAGQLHALGLNVMVFDYRGFGHSAGTASESHIEEDAEAAYQNLIRRGVDPSRIILWGHSLGSGPAVWLASRYPAAALVLFGAYASIPEVAQDTYPWLPVRWLVGIHFDSLDRIGSVRAPVLIAHSRQDALVAFHHAQELFAAAHEPRQLLELPGPYTDGLGGHVDSLYDHLDLIVPWLQKLTGASLTP
ncbi:MAG TPA: alpha/beta hydrolase, partial [Steroidobacteraceae bacterium]|nr:alpha/beta hydrolase [Steroidobacteraceae bacterium]